MRVLRDKRRTGPHAGTLDLAVPWALVVASVALAAYGLLAGFRLALFFARWGCSSPYRSCVF